MVKIKAIFLSFFLVAIFSCKKSSVNNASLVGSSSSNLSGTKWIVYQYKDASVSIPLTRNDTLVFTNATNYKYNGQINKYYLNSGNNTHLTLGQTPFSDIDGIVPNTFVTNGEIIAVPFSQMKTNGLPAYYLWVKKI
jgi:hypothetical protein